VSRPSKAESRPQDDRRQVDLDLVEQLASNACLAMLARRIR